MANFAKYAPRLFSKSPQFFPPLDKWISERVATISKQRIALSYKKHSEAYISIQGLKCFPCRMC